MRKPLRKLIAFSTAAAAMLSGTTLYSAAAYVSEQIEECDYDTLIRTGDKNILVKDGNADNIGEDAKLIIIDDNGEKKLVDKSLGINGIYNYVSTTMGQYNYISPTNPGYSFDFFDESYRISTETNGLIVGIGNKFALMNNDQEIISDLYGNIYRINNDYFIIDDSADAEYEYSDDSTGFDDNKSGLMKADGSVIVPPTEGIVGFYLTSSEKNFLVKSESGYYFIDLEGSQVTEKYSEFREISHNYEASYHYGNHFYQDKYAMNYLLCRGLMLSDGDTYIVMDDELNILHENADDANEIVEYDHDTGEYTYYYEIKVGEDVYVYDTAFDLVSQRKEIEGEAKVKFDTGAAVLKDNQVTVYNKEYTQWVDIENPDAYDIEYIGSDSEKGDFFIEYYTGDGYEYKYYSVSKDLQVLDVTDYVTCERFSDDTLWVFSEEDLAYEIIDYNGKVIQRFSEIHNEWYKYVSGYYVISAGNVFSVLDSDLNLIWEDIVGCYDGWRYYMKNYSEDGSYTLDYGFFDFERGVVIPIEYKALRQHGDYYFAVTKGNLDDVYCLDMDGNIVTLWDNSYVQNGETCSSFDTIEAFGDKYTAIIDGDTVIFDSEMNIIQQWQGVYKYESGTYSAYTVDLTFNKRENGETSTIVYNSDTNVIDYEQTGVYDHVSYCLAGYMIVTNYDDSENLWSGGNAQGIIKLDGTEVISPTERLNISMGINWGEDIQIAEAKDVLITLTGDAEGDDGGYGWYYRSPITDIQYEYARQNGFVFAYKTEYDTYVTAKEFSGEKSYILFGMADESGNVLLENDYRYPMEFYNGLAEIREYKPVIYEEYDEWADEMRTGYTVKAGIVDALGRIIVEPFQNKTLAIEFGLNDIKAPIVECEETGGFHVRRLLETGEYEYKDHIGGDILNDFALENGYDAAKAEGDLYCVEKDGLAGVVTKDNQILVPVQYESLLSFNPCSHSMKYVRSQLHDLLKQQFASKLRKLSDGSMLVSVKDTNGKIGIYKIYDDGAAPVETTTTTATTTTTSSTSSKPSITTTTTAKKPIATTTTKKTIATTTVPPATIPVTTTTEAAPKVAFGDVDNNGSIDALDASIILTEYALIATNHDSLLNADQKKAADLNKDGNVDALDASLVLSYYAYKATGGTKNLIDYLN